MVLTVKKLAGQIIKTSTSNSAFKYEEGGENCIINGDKYSETFLSEIFGAKPIKGRHISIERLMSMVQELVFGD